MPLAFCKHTTGSGSFSYCAANGQVYASATGNSAQFLGLVAGISADPEKLKATDRVSLIIPLGVVQQALKRVVRFDEAAQSLKMIDIVSNVKELGVVLEVLLGGTKEKFEGVIHRDQLPHLCEQMKDELVARGYSPNAFVLGVKSFLWAAAFRKAVQQSCAEMAEEDGPTK
jgi:hypothetical protein